LNYYTYSCAVGTASVAKRDRRDSITNAGKLYNEEAFLWASARESWDRSSPEEVHEIVDDKGTLYVLYTD